MSVLAPVGDALAMAGWLFRKGASFTSAMVFEHAEHGHAGQKQVEREQAG
ncbi:MAG TPA: hypothetical protein VFX52_11900 [Nocardioidaceae bacterium]|jgi:hypothetical protein|nr:hypothetical protein [Nocardioidaceae bacterium]